MTTAGKTPVWLEVALNGAWGQDQQPGIPIRADEIIAEAIACARAGAAIIHVHAYDEATGKQNDDPATYARIIAGIRSQVDVIVYPTIPLLGADAAGSPTAARQRFAAIAELGAKGLLEWAVIDPGSINLVREADVRAGQPGAIYINHGVDIAEGLDLAERHGFHPSYAIYEPGFARLGARLVQGRPHPAAHLPADVFR